MNYAQDWARWHAVNDYTPNQQKYDRQKYRAIRKNQALEIGTQFRCACCGKTMIKHSPEQATCGKDRCLRKFHHLTGANYVKYYEQKQKEGWD